MNPINWVWEITGWRSRREENCSSCWRNPWNVLRIRAGFHHGPWSQTKEDGFFFYSLISMVQLPWSDFLHNQFTKYLDPSLGVNEEEWPRFKKWMCWILKRYDPKRRCWEKRKKIQVWPFSCLLLSITNFIGPWDDFMVHDVNNPSVK